MKKMRTHRAYWIEWTSNYINKNGSRTVRYAGPFNTVSKRMVDNLNAHKVVWEIIKKGTGHYMESFGVVAACKSSFHEDCE